MITEQIDFRPHGFHNILTGKRTLTSATSQLLYQRRLGFTQMWLNLAHLLQYSFIYSKYIKNILSICCRQCANFEQSSDCLNSVYRA